MWQPIDIDDGVSGLAHAVRQRFDAPTDRVQQFFWRIKSTVLRGRYTHAVMVCDPLQDREGLTDIVGVDIGASHRRAVAETGHRYEADLALAERVYEQPAT